MAWRAGTVTRPPRMGWLVSNSVAEKSRGKENRRSCPLLFRATIQLENVELLVRVRLQWVKRAAAQRGVGLAERDELLVVGQQL